jgi:soluble lytic murein transglycosylase-like protein
VLQRFSQLRLTSEVLLGFGRGIYNEKQIKWGTLPVDNGNNQDILKTNCYSDYGRFLRTRRWHSAIKKSEEKYNIESCLLAGLVMQESMGNPLQLNFSGDGGAGLMMFQPGTADEYNLRVIGNSKATGRDHTHGQLLKELVKTNKLDYNKLSVIDERFHIEKSIQAGARFLSKLYKKYGSWDMAISAYNRGTPAAFPQSTTHVRMVRHFQRYYRNKI